LISRILSRKIPISPGWGNTPYVAFFSSLFCSLLTDLFFLIPVGSTVPWTTVKAIRSFRFTASSDLLSLQDFFVCAHEDHPSHPPDPFSEVSPGHPHFSSNRPPHGQVPRHLPPNPPYSELPFAVLHRLPRQVLSRLLVRVWKWDVCSCSRRRIAPRVKPAKFSYLSFPFLSPSLVISC